METSDFQTKESEIELFETSKKISANSQGTEEAILIVALTRATRAMYYLYYSKEKLLYMYSGKNVAFGTE